MWVWGRVKIMWGQRWYASKASEAWDVWGWGRMMGVRVGVKGWKRCWGLGVGA